MMQAFFKDLVCHGDPNDSFDHSGSEGGDSPRSPMLRTNTVVVTSALPPNRRSRARSLKKEWGAKSGGEHTVWEDTDHSLTDNTIGMFDIDSKGPAIARIPKHQRLSFADENEGINTVRANYDPSADRCKAMDLAVKQAAEREDAARAMLSAPAPPKRSPALGAKSAPKSPTPRLPSPPKQPQLGFANSLRRIDTLPPPPNSSRTQNRCETPEPAKRVGVAASPLPSGLHGGAVLPQRPQGPPPTRPTPSPRCNSSSKRPIQSPQSLQRPQSSSFMIKPGQPGPPRCPSNSSQSSQLRRALSAGRVRSVHSAPRSNSYMQSSDSFALSGATTQGVWSHPAPDASPQASTQNRSCSRTPITPRPIRGQSNSYIAPTGQSNSYVPPPGQSNSFVPPPSGSPMSRNNSYLGLPQTLSYVPAPSSPMVVSGSQPNLSTSPEPQYPNSIERMREAGIAMCSRLFAPPPRMLSFEPPPNPPNAATAARRGAPAHRAQRNMSCDAPRTSSFMPLPLPLTNVQVQRANSYEPPLIINR